MAPVERGLCRWCRGLVKPPRQSWCSQACVDEYLLRKSSARVRSLVFRRDRGVCALCCLDTERLRRLYVSERQRITEYLWRLGRTLVDPARVTRAAWRHDLFNWPARVGGVLIDGRRWLINDASRTLWEADHIVPVAEGGGACGLDNYRTLCIWCHPKETGKLRKRLNAKRRA